VQLGSLVDTVSYVAQLIGVAVFAASGCLSGGQKRMDLFGVTVVGSVTALGGGTLRDLVLDQPVFWVVDNAYLLVAGVSVAVTFFAVRYLRAPNGTLLVLDALGLALFTVLGAQKALNLGTTMLIAVMMGAMTGAVGGLLRDLLCNELPRMFFSRDLYATPALAGAATYVALSNVGPVTSLPMVAGFSVTLALRLASLKFDLGLPVFRDRHSGAGEHDGEI